MDTHIAGKFAEIGARLIVAGQPSGGYSLDLRSDRKGSYFALGLGPAAPVEATVVDVHKASRHLLLLVRDGGSKDKYLCGLDERDWFVAAVPDAPGVSGVRSALEALKPAAVITAQGRRKVKPKHRSRRKTKAYKRQGEWFFIPAPNGFAVDGKLLLHNEPLRRGAGKPHLAEECFRAGGVTVYVCRHYPNGLTAEEHRSLLQREPAARFYPWEVRSRDPDVYVRGRIRHPDHKTLVLRGWHRVHLNTESRARAMQHVAFID